MCFLCTTFPLLRGPDVISRSFIYHEPSQGWVAAGSRHPASSGVREGRGGVSPPLLGHISYSYFPVSASRAFLVPATGWALGVSAVAHPRQVGSWLTQ